MNSIWKDNEKKLRQHIREIYLSRLFDIIDSGKKDEVLHVFIQNATTRSIAKVVDSFEVKK